MIFSAYNLNKQGDNIQLWCTSLQILNQTVVPCPVTLASWPACTFLRRQVKWSGIPKTWRIVQLVVMHTVKGFSQWNRVDVFLLLLLGNLIPGSSAFSKPSFYILNFSIYILLKPSLKDFEHNHTSLWNECNCMVIWTFFGVSPSLGS